MFGNVIIVLSSSISVISQHTNSVSYWFHESKFHLPVLVALKGGGGEKVAKLNI